MPRIAVKHPDGLHLIYSTIMDDFLCGAFTTDELPAACEAMDRNPVPIYRPSFFDPKVRDDPAQWQKYWGLCVDINGIEAATARVNEMLARRNQEPAA
jgi:hypothetical protein